MSVQSLDNLDAPDGLTADVVIIGGGACGLTLARALAAPGRTVLVLESGGLREDEAHEALNTVDMADATWTALEAEARDRYHRNLTRHWNGSRQRYGVRCRGLGGSTQAWAGKSAPFDPLDLEQRDWVDRSGWPIGLADLASYINRAEGVLNLGPGPYDAGMWAHLNRSPPDPAIPEDALRTIFWKFARSRRSLTDIMRLGADFAANPPDGVRVLTHATVTRLKTDPGGRRVLGATAQSLAGRSVSVSMPVCILSASTIENARLLLMSRDADPRGLGNAHDRVGRCLVDHPTTTIATYGPEAARDLARRFGLYGRRDGGHTHVCMHGLALDPGWQRAQRALNGAVFTTELRASDDPFAAASRLVKGRSPDRMRDAASVLRSPGLMLRGVTARAIERGHIPRAVSRRLVEVALRAFPNTVARDFQSGQMPVKLSGARIEATTEQPPLEDNRITLSDRQDAFGQPLPRVTWRAGDQARTNLLRIGQQFGTALEKAGLPPPRLSEWVVSGSPDEAVVIDLGHPMGSTRMANDPQDGVVDGDCKVHGVEGLYVAGGSVFPTSGHANPTLMMLALSLRLADHIDRCMGRGGSR